MNISRHILVIIIFLFIITPVGMVSAYFNVGRQGQGGQIYVSRGFVDANTDIVLFVWSELANGSNARTWEVAVAVLPQQDNVQYRIDIRDSHMALDDEFSSDAVISPDESEAVGERSFGPFLVWASADEDYGMLEWDIQVSSRDGRDVYVDMFLTWGYGTGNPPEINGSPDVEVNETVNETGASDTGIHPRVVVLVAASIAIAGKMTYDRSINQKIDDKEKIVEGDRLE